MIARSGGSVWNPAQIAVDLEHPTLRSFVDMLRWVAALVVMVSHLRAPLLMGFGQLEAAQKPIWVKAWYFMTGMHLEAVIVFFVLSGFLVGGLSAARAADGRFEPSSYAIDRIARLYVSFLPALLLTLMLDTIGTHWFAESGLWNGTNPQLLLKDPKLYDLRLGWTTLLGNLLMLQSYFVDPFGSNDPLWTLSNEFWFYVVFGLVLTAWLSRLRSRAVSAILASAIVLALGPWFIGYFGLWLIGFGAACIAPRRAGSCLLPVASLFGCLAAIRLFSDRLEGIESLRMTAHYVLALAVGWLLLTVRGRRFAWLEGLAPLNTFMADFSYSLYLVHIPIIWLAIAILGKVTGIAGFRNGFAPTDPVGILAYTGLIVFTLGASWLFAQGTERHTKHIRNWLKRSFKLTIPSGIRQ